MATIAHGSTVSMHFSLSLEDGTEALSTFGEDPICFTMGDGTLQQGMEFALFGLQPGDEQTLSLTPEQAYGLRNDELIHQLPRDSFPDDMALERGQVISFSAEGNEEALGTIYAVAQDTVSVDFNHPLAGHQLTYRVQIMEVNNG